MNHKEFNCDELTSEEFLKLFWYEECPRCGEEIVTKYHDNDGGCWICGECNLKYWKVY